MAGLKVTLKHSIIGRPQSQRGTVKALGFTKANSSMVKPFNETIKGMINTVSHLMDVEGV